MNYRTISYSCSLLFENILELRDKNGLNLSQATAKMQFSYYRFFIANLLIEKFSIRFTFIFICFKSIIQFYWIIPISSESNSESCSNIIKLKQILHQQPDIQRPWWGFPSRNPVVDSTSLLELSSPRIRDILLSQAPM